MLQDVKLALPQTQLEGVCQRHAVRELALFGSGARGELRPDSDLDFLVEFQPGARVSLLELAAMMRELTEITGRKVDLVVKSALKPLLKHEVLTEARVVYAA